MGLEGLICACRVPVWRNHQQSYESKPTSFFLLCFTGFQSKPVCSLLRFTYYSKLLKIFLFICQEYHSSIEEWTSYACLCILKVVVFLSVWNRRFLTCSRIFDSWHMLKNHLCWQDGLQGKVCNANFNWLKPIKPSMPPIYLKSKIFNMLRNVPFLTCQKLEIFEHAQESLILDICSRTTGPFQWRWSSRFMPPVYWPVVLDKPRSKYNLDKPNCTNFNISYHSPKGEWYWKEF